MKYTVKTVEGKDYVVDLDSVRHMLDQENDTVKIVLGDKESIFISKEERDSFVKGIKAIKVFIIDTDDTIMESNAGSMLYDKTKVYSMADAKKILKAEQAIFDKDMVEAEELLSKEQLVEAGELEHKIKAILEAYYSLELQIENLEGELEAQGVNEAISKEIISTTGQLQPLRMKIETIEEKLFKLTPIPLRDWEDIRIKIAMKIKNAQ